jgi:hypothetical protein
MPPAIDTEELKQSSTTNNKRKSFYDYSDYGNLQDQIDLSDDSEGMSFSSED